MLDKKSKELRKTIIHCLIDANRGHFGSSMSIIEILRVLYELSGINYKNYNKEKRDKIILSKGHGCLGLYSILYSKKILKKKDLKGFTSFNSKLGGHPEFKKVPGVEASTGSLGHGFPLAVGMAIGNKLKNYSNKVYCVVGDGEMNEGSNWEAAMIASKHSLKNLYLIIDYNKIQSYGFTKEVMDLEPLKEKLKSFGFETKEVDGHDIYKIKKQIKSFKSLKKPKCLICHTVKGKGFKIAENEPTWHHKNFFLKEEIKKLKESLE